MFRFRADEVQRREKELEELTGGTLRATPQSCECIKPMYLFADSSSKLNIENQRLFDRLFEGRVTASRGIGASFCADHILLQLSEENMFRCHTGESEGPPPMPLSKTGHFLLQINGSYHCQLFILYHFYLFIIIESCIQLSTFVLLDS